MLQLITALAAAYSVATGRLPASAVRGAPTARRVAPSTRMALPIDLKGKTAFVAGVADSTGYGWAIAKALAEAGATITVGTWPPVLGIFQKSLATGKFDDDMVLSDGSKMMIEKVYPLDATFDAPADVPDDVKNNKRYAGTSSYTISEVAKAVGADYGKIDILVHSLANGPEVTKPLLQTSRKGYVSERTRALAAQRRAPRPSTRARVTRAARARARARAAGRGLVLAASRAERQPPVGSPAGSHASRALAPRAAASRRGADGRNVCERLLVRVAAAALWPDHE